jgi:hypothetical protein
MTQSAGGQIGNDAQPDSAVLADSVVQIGNAVQAGNVVQVDSAVQAGNAVEVKQLIVNLCQVSTLSKATSCSSNGSMIPSSVI